MKKVSFYTLGCKVNQYETNGMTQKFKEAGYEIVDLNNDNQFDSGAVTVGGATLHCWKHGGHGAQTYLEVVENSCNPGFVNLGLKLGKILSEKFGKYSMMVGSITLVLLGISHLI